MALLLIVSCRSLGSTALDVVRMRRNCDSNMLKVFGGVRSNQLVRTKL